MIGSIWNKWDLHIHSPMTHHNNQYNDTSTDDFVDSLHSNDLSLIGITNYFFFKDNELEAVRESIRLKSYGITVLGNLEFRINQQNKDGEWINIHCIFAEHLATCKINEVLSKLLITNTTNSGHNVYCSADSLNGSGIQLHEVTVDFKQLLNHFNSSLHFGTDYLIAVCPNGYGGFRPNIKEGRSTALAIEIEKHGQIILGRSEDREFFLGTSRYEGSQPKPVFISSDAHRLSDIGSNYSWVKAKPTFEGLRQAIIEPSERVQQTDSFIENTYIKPKFKTVEVGGTIFQGQEITFAHKILPLNPNMIAIIGGRGTGKSLFLDAMHSRFNHNLDSSNARQVDIENLKLVLDQGDGTELTFDSDNNTYSYLHVSQGDVQKFSQNPNDLSGEIKRMLRIHEEDFNPIASNEIADIIGRYRSFVVDYWEAIDAEGRRINTPVYQQSIVDRNKQLISTLTSPQNKQLIEQYQLNTQAINERIGFINESNNIISLIDRTVNELNQKIASVNTKTFAKTQLPLVETQQTAQVALQNIKQCEQEIKQFTDQNTAIVLQFQQQGIHQDVSSLLSKVTEYQQAIDSAQQKLHEITQRTEQYHSYVARRGELALTYNEYVMQQKQKIDNAFFTLQEKKAHWNEEQNELVKEILSDIKIEGSIVFDINKFYFGLEACINRGKFRTTSDKTTLKRLEETFCIRTKEDFFNLLSGNQLIKVDGEQKSIEDFFWLSEYFNQGGRFELLNYLFSPASIKNYLYVNADFEYKSKTVDKLSVGQRGTFYVSLKLATDPFGSPFVFDQPEDDLDNEFIMKQLVPLFRKIKKYRQVIIVTHNANLVVNTDVEQVIVANNEGEVISYFAGAVEDGNVLNNTGIRASICNILEGGSYAFEKREKKYGIQTLV